MTNPASVVAMGPIVETLRPMISAFVTAIVGLAVTFGVALLKRWTGVTVQSTYVDLLCKRRRLKQVFSSLRRLITCQLALSV